MMFKPLILIACCIAGKTSFADGLSERVVSEYILPAYENLEQSAGDLVQATEICGGDEAALRSAYGEAFDAWIKVSHLHFGPVEQGERYFALSFWPDSRGATPKALRSLISAQDRAVDDVTEFATVSVAGRGFYALEFLLYDPEFLTQDGYRCDLIRAIATDIEVSASDILKDWQESYGALLSNPGGNDTYRSENEALRELFGALSTGVQFSSETRLGRPLGTFDKPRPTRAEARRSQRSLRHVILSLEAHRELALLLSENIPELNADLTEAFDLAIRDAQALDDPVFATVSEPQARFRIESLQQRVEDIRAILGGELGPALGVQTGFNALDGD